MVSFSNHLVTHLESFVKREPLLKNCPDLIVPWPCIVLWHCIDGLLM